MLETYAGLDVSDKQTHLCVLDGAGGVLWRGRAASDVDGRSGDSGPVEKVAGP